MLQWRQSGVRYDFDFEVESIQALRSTDGLKVILAELMRRATADTLVDVSEPSWAIVRAHKDGQVHGLRSFHSWLVGRLSHELEESPPTEA
jgi:hypothetical protein